MPVQFLSEQEHENLNHFPSEIAAEDLDRFFFLSDSDRKAIMHLRGDPNRLGYALQICCLRFLGFFPEDLSQLPQIVVNYVAQQLEVELDDLALYGKRASTQRNHQRQIQLFLGYRRAAPIDLLGLEQWLLERALEHDKPTFLFQMACEHLHQNKIVRIGTTRLEKLVSTARQQAQEFCYQLLQPLLTEQCCKFLDRLLEVDIVLGSTQLSWLQRTPTSNNTTQILETLDKIAFLQRHGIEQWDFGQLNPNRTNYLAGIGAKSSNQYLQRTNESRRYPILAAFLKRSLYNFIDDLIEMVDQRLLDLHSEARRIFETERLQATRTINQKLKTLQDIGSILLNQNIADHSIRTTTFAHISPEQLKNSLAEVEPLIRPENDAYVDYFCKFYNRVRKFSSRLLSTLEFQTQGNDPGLLRALEIVREIHAGERRKLPTSAPIDFIPANWHNYVFESEGVNWRHYELAALWVLRLKIRSGDIYVSHSRRFSPLEAYLISGYEWQSKCSKAVNLMGVPIEAAIRLEERECELVSLVAQVEAILNDVDGGLREERGKLILTPFEAEPRSEQLNQLTSTITARLPKLDLTDLLVEVDNWTHFSAALEHLHTPQQRDSKLLLHLYTCLLTQACNLEFQQMASATGLTARNLSWHNTWYIRDDTLRSANNALVNYHYHLPLSRIWGSGMLSSSDGQRFPAKGSLRQARSLPRYFGYGKGITFYSKFHIRVAQRSASRNQSIISSRETLSKAARIA
jgi:TnpA family transposase